MPRRRRSWPRWIPPLRRRRTFEAITRVLLRESLNQPLLLLIEDLHWLDSETEAWLQLLSERVPTAWRRHTPLPSRHWRRPVRSRNVATRRMRCASSATSQRGVHPPEVEKAEEHYRQALALAEELGMRPLQAHCHRGLGTLYAKTGRQEQARAELSTAIEMYRAMDMTFWLPQAEAALAQVARE